MNRLLLALTIAVFVAVRFEVSLMFAFFGKHKKCNKKEKISRFLRFFQKITTKKGKNHKNTFNNFYSRQIFRLPERVRFLCIKIAKRFSHKLICFVKLDYFTRKFIFSREISD
jgi:hypothetical protein